MVYWLSLSSSIEERNAEWQYNVRITANYRVNKYIMVTDYCNATWEILALQSYRDFECSVLIVDSQRSEESEVQTRI